MHLLDKCFTRLAAFFSSEWWGDSKTTLAQRITGCPAKSRRVISFVTRRLNSPERKALTPTFIFWGRITEVKALKRAVSILAGIRKALPNARYVIIGPDGGQLQTVKSEVTKLGLENSITFCGEMRIDQIEYEAAHASFYLQTSLHEGMAMSVVEAMQLGLVPVVTPVGEIANYARHGENALVVNDDKEAVTDVLALLNNDALYQAMRDRAVASWSGQPLYKDSMLAACRELLGIKSASCCEKKFDEKMKTAREFE
jgi:glycosyltransferase involved in cell wall biosynthesis